MKNNVLFLALLLLLLAGCSEDYTPRPRGYFRIPLPERKYQTFDRPGFPYTFEYPVYGQIVQDTLFFDDRPENPYWINIDFPQFGGRVHISYKPVGSNSLDSLINDAFTLSYKQHTYKASRILPEEFSTPNGSGGVYFSLGGNTATANQFFITDSTRHFLRGALYFGATPNEDSLRPVNAFLKEDVQHLIQTLRWKS